MLGSRSDLVKKVKKLVLEAKGAHCFIHRYALASKTLPSTLQKVLDLGKVIVNCIKAGSLNTRHFKELCKDKNSTHETLFFHTAVRWLSKGNFVNRVFKMKYEIKLFLNFKNKYEFSHFEDNLWVANLSYLADILYLNTQYLKSATATKRYKYYTTT